MSFATQPLPLQGDPRYHAGFKALWKRDAVRYGRALGAEFRKRGFLGKGSVYFNAGGIAVPGEVCGTFFRPGAQRGIWFELSISEHVDSHRQDNAFLMVRWTDRTDPNKHTATGPNRFLDPTIAPRDLVDQILRVCEVTP